MPENERRKERTEKEPVLKFFSFNRGKGNGGVVKPPIEEKKIKNNCF